MYAFLGGFITGVYVGTYYDCKPVLEKCKDYMKKYFPKPK